MVDTRRVGLHPDRHLPADPGLRALARQIYQAVADLPIVSPHGHVEASVLADDQAFPDPATLLVTSDHYVTRLIHAQGVSLDQLGLGPEPAPPAAVWAQFCGHWDAFRGTPSRAWLEMELFGLLGASATPSPATADALFAELAHRLAGPDMRPRALYQRFGLEVLATTDDPCSDLSAHLRLRDDPGWGGRVVPTFRPDAYLDPATEGWGGRLEALAQASGLDTGTYDGYLSALEARRDHFRALGATCTDHAPPDAGTEHLDAGDAGRLYRAAARGDATHAEAAAFRRHMLFEMARMSSEDGLVMQLHPSVLRGHHTASLRRYGPDTGHDIPTAAEFTRALRPVLEAFGDHPRFRIVVHTVDETTWSRELAPLAGFYPAVYIGAPWWFLDTPAAMVRFRAAVTDTAGFYKCAGFVDDTRAFCSIPARHDLARRVDAGYLAELVATHALSEEEALETAHDLAYRLPKSVYRLG